MGLVWTILPEAELVMVVGTGSVARADIETYLVATVEEGARAFSKIVDLSFCNLALDRDDLDAVAKAMNTYAEDHDVGPVAMVARTPLNIDVLTLLRQRIDPRAVRIFADTKPATDWIMSFRHMRTIHPFTRQLILASLTQLHR